MLKYCGGIHNGEKANSKKSETYSNDLSFVESNLSNKEISLTSLNEIKWFTNAIEPEQQRGPSENA